MEETKIKNRSDKAERWITHAEKNGTLYAVFCVIFFYMGFLALLRGISDSEYLRQASHGITFMLSVSVGLALRAIYRFINTREQKE